MLNHLEHDGDRHRNPDDNRDYAEQLDPQQLEPAAVEQALAMILTWEVEQP